MVDHAECSRIVSAWDSGDTIVANDLVSDSLLATAFRSAECCRILRRPDIAAGILREIENTTAANSQRVKDAIERHKLKIQQHSVEPLQECQIAHIQTVSSDTQPFSLPPLGERVSNFITAMIKHAASGFARCDQETIDARLAVCRDCPNLQNNHCSACGCACNSADTFLNKLALTTEKCPLGKW